MLASDETDRAGRTASRRELGSEVASLLTAVLEKVEASMAGGGERMSVSQTVGLVAFVKM